MWDKVPSINSFKDFFVRETVQKREQFYAGRFGGAAQAMVMRRLNTLWPDMDGLDVLAYGYAIPYLHGHENTAHGRLTNPSPTRNINSRHPYLFHLNAIPQPPHKRRSYRHTDGHADCIVQRGQQTLRAYIAWSRIRRSNRQLRRS